jgi:maleylacetoacetate isomerase
MKLYSYYRSSAAFRVRIALNIKGIDYEIVPINLLKHEHETASYRLINPQARVPTLVDGDIILTQSMAIIEYLNEKYPSPALLPQSLEDRAWVRRFSQIIVSDIHPLNNSGTLNYLKNVLHHDQEQCDQWYFNTLRNGFDTLEAMIIANKRSGQCCLGNEISIADICLIPQMYNAQRYHFPLTNYPHLQAINDHCLKLPYVEKARPENQIDAV